MKAICLPRRNRSSFWAFLSSKLTFFLKWEFWMILFKSRTNLRVQHFKIGNILSSNCSWGLRFIQWTDHLHFFDPEHSFRWKIRTSSNLSFLNSNFHTKNDCGWGNLSNCGSDSCYLCCPTKELCGSGISEFMVDGLLANIGIGILRLSCSSSIAKEVPVSIGCATDSVFLCVAQ